MKKSKPSKKGKLLKKGKSFWPAKCPFGPKEWTYLQKKYHLSLRELQVAICICSGCNNQQIAEKCKISKRTVESHLRNIYLKTGINNKTLLLLHFLHDVKAGL